MTSLQFISPEHGPAGFLAKLWGKCLEPWSGWLGWQNSNREMVDSVCVAIWSRERVSKLANLSVIETVILSSSAKPYLGAKVQSFREYQPKRERYRFLTRRRSPEVQYPRGQKRALLTVTLFCRRTISGKGLAEGVILQINSLQWLPEAVIGQPPAPQAFSRPRSQSGPYTPIMGPSGRKLLFRLSTGE